MDEFGNRPTASSPSGEPSFPEIIHNLGLNLSHLFEHVQVTWSARESLSGPLLGSANGPQNDCAGLAKLCPCIDYRANGFRQRKIGPADSWIQRATEPSPDHRQVWRHSWNSAEKWIVRPCKGAFTGATADKIGKWQLADRGTLFLDEIGDMLPAHQVKLLCALENNIIQRVGGTAGIKVFENLIHIQPTQAKIYWDQEVQVEFSWTLSVILNAIEDTMVQV